MLYSLPVSKVGIISNMSVNRCLDVELGEVAR